MLDMGFIHDIKKVLALLPQKKQSLLFSATFSDEIKELADRLLNSPGADRGRAAQPDRRADRAEGAPGRPRDEEGPARPPDQGERLAPGARLHAHEARRQPPRRAPERSTASARWRSTATRARPRAPRRSPTSRTATCRCWSRPTSPRAASTSTSCRTSSTSSCRTCPRTTCTASAAPAAPAPRARRSRWSASTRNGFLRDIERLIKRAIPREIVPGFEPTAHERAEPIVLGRMVIGDGGTSAAAAAVAAVAGASRRLGRRRRPAAAARRRAAPRQRAAAQRRRRAPGAGGRVAHGRWRRRRPRSAAGPLQARWPAPGRSARRGARCSPARPAWSAGRCCRCCWRRPRRRCTCCCAARCPSCRADAPAACTHVVDFAALPALPAVDDVYIALGTTIKVAGSQAAFRAVDFDAVVATARAARAAGAHPPRRRLGARRRRALGRLLQPRQGRDGGRRRRARLRPAW